MKLAYNFIFTILVCLTFINISSMDLDLDFNSNVSTMPPNSPRNEKDAFEGDSIESQEDFNYFQICDDSSSEDKDKKERDALEKEYIDKLTKIYYDNPAVFLKIILFDSFFDEHHKADEKIIQELKEKTDVFNKDDSINLIYLSASRTVAKAVLFGNL